MPNAADDLQDSLIQRQIELIALSNSMIRNVQATMSATEPKTLATLREELERLTGILPTQFAIRSAAVERAIAEITKQRDEAWAKAFLTGDDSLRAQLIEVGNDEVESTVEAITDALPVEIGLVAVPPEQIIAAVNKRPFQGAVMKDWAQGLAINERKRLAGLIRQSVIEGRTVDEIVRGVRGTRAGGFKDGILQTGRREAEAVVRTAVQHVTNGARNDVFEANGDVIAGVKWTATLDGRTTAICRKRDGNVAMFHGHPVPKGYTKLTPINARPPAHWNCRSTMVAIFDPEGIADKIGDRPFVRTAKTRRRREMDFRRQTHDKLGDAKWRSMTPKERNRAISKTRKAWTKANVGTVPTETTYADWLKRQTPDFQNEVLGPARGKLFRSGAETLDTFVDNKGRQFTLVELKSRREKRKKNARSS